MTTPTTPTPQASQPTEAEKFRAEIRRAFEHIEERLADLTELTHETRAALLQMREGLTIAAAKSAPAVGTFAEMQIETIVMTYDDNGKPAYKAKGAPYQKHGVRVWDEVLPALGIDPASLKPGPNAQTPPITARVLMGETTDDNGQPRTSPRKVTGKA